MELILISLPVQLRTGATKTRRKGAIILPKGATKTTILRVNS